MNSKSVLTSIFGVLIFSLFFGYSLVFAGTGIFDNSTKAVFKLSENIYLDSLELNQNSILFKSGNDLTNYKIQSECDIFSKLKYENGDYYMFDIKFFGNECESEKFNLLNTKGEVEASFNLKLVKEYDALSKLLDLKTTRLVQLRNVLDKKINELSFYSEYNEKYDSNYYNFLAKNRELNEAIYNRDLLNNIISKRDEKYIIAVEGKQISTKLNKLPNTGRPYRASYTDGIHHGWDIDAEVGDIVLALDDAIVVRVVNNFNYSDLNKINYGDNLTYLDKLWNLDTLRGNQIWLKTMKGDVAFYSHLDQIYSNIKEGDVVKKGQPIGTVGITGVPDKDYADSHLHLPIHVNPFDTKKMGNYSYEDYMTWDWYFKGKSSSYILENQSNIFE